MQTFRITSFSGIDDEVFLDEKVRHHLDEVSFRTFSLMPLVRIFPQQFEPFFHSWAQPLCLVFFCVVEEIDLDLPFLLEPQLSKVLDRFVAVVQEREDQRQHTSHRPDITS